MLVFTMYKVLYVVSVWTSVAILPNQVENSLLFKNRESILRKSQQKCNQYVLQACKGVLNVNSGSDSSNTVSFASSVAGDFSPMENTTQIGNVTHYVRYIVGGEISVPKQYPHMVWYAYCSCGINTVRPSELWILQREITCLQTKWNVVLRGANISSSHGSGSISEIRWFCGGSLISEQYVLGAAHCVSNDREVTQWVRLGELDLETVTDEANTKDIEIIGIIVHPEYKHPNLYNDIALFRLKTSVTFNDFIRPICLNTHQVLNITRATVAGWGSTGYGEKRSPKLLSVDLDIQKSDNCDKIYRGAKMKSGFNDSTMICAGYAPGGKDSCQGDSGGPLMVDLNAGCPKLYLQIGIVSFGEGCAFQDTPAIYTKVSYFISWIESIVWR